MCDSIKWERLFLVVTSLLFCGFMTACSMSEPNGDVIISKSIGNAGGRAFEHSRIHFTLRGKRYMVERRGEKFIYQRSFTDSTGNNIVDRMTNAGFKRQKNGEKATLSASQMKEYKNALNSVVYFALLPYKLNDPAVKHKYIGEAVIDGEKYYEIKISFSKDRGGKDYKDTFVYWIHHRSYNMDYLAYRYHVNEGGSRFRKAHNVRRVKGIRFADYHNFKGLPEGDSLAQYNSLFKDRTVQKVSEVNLEDIKVELLSQEN